MYKVKLFFFVIFSLGAAHDSDGNNCPNNTGYVMEASSGVGGDPVENLRLWEFSTCSVDYFNIFSTGLNRYVNACFSCKLFNRSYHMTLRLGLKYPHAIKSINH